jgi:hypothetical protein
LAPWRSLFVAADAPWRFGTDAPERIFADAGWDAVVKQPGDTGARYARWPLAPPSRLLRGIPRVFLIDARRLPAREPGPARTGADGRTRAAVVGDAPRARDGHRSATLTPG